MYYAIGDVHGEYDLLVRLYDKIVKDATRLGKPATVVFLGDYIDRGTGSIKVLDFLRHLEDTADLRHIFIRGNHEVMFLDALDNPTSRSDVGFWVKYGGYAVLQEVDMDWETFHGTFRWQVYSRWIREATKPFHQADGYAFVHGGLDVRLDVSTQMPDNLMWSRHMETDHYRGYRDMVIHGHTSRGAPVVDANRVSIDTSQGTPGKKVLTCAVLPQKADGSVRFLTTERIL